MIESRNYLLEKFDFNTPIQKKEIFEIEEKLRISFRRTMWILC